MNVSQDYHDAITEQSWWELRLVYRDEEDNDICLATTPGTKQL